MLSNEGVNNLNLLRDTINNIWKNNVIILNEKESQAPIDAFEIQMLLYAHYRVILEYETGTFALKIWTGKKFDYLDNFTNEKVVYGFDSMKPENLLYNFQVLDRLIRKNMN